MAVGAAHTQNAIARWLRAAGAGARYQRRNRAVLDKLGISLIKAANAGCCGAISYHLNAQQEGLDYMRRNVDAWWPYVKREAWKLLS